MTLALSRQELDALLGDWATQLPPPGPFSIDTLRRFGQEAVRCLEDLLSIPNTFLAGIPSATAWDKLQATLGIAPGTRLLLTEVRLADSEVVVLVATTTLTAYRLDEIALRAGGIGKATAPFAAWRRLVESVMTETWLTVARPGEVAPLWQSQSPRVWDVSVASDTGLRLSRDEPIAVVPLHTEDDERKSVFLIVPATTASCLDASAAEAEAAAVDETGTPPDYSLVDEVPLSVSAVMDTGQLPVHHVARWQVGSLVSLTLIPGQIVCLQANGKPIAQGKLVERDDQSLAVKIITLSP